MFDEVNKKRIYKYTKERVTTTLIRYDHRLSKEDGVKGSIIKDVESFGVKVLHYEEMRHFGLSLIETTKAIKNPPRYIIHLPHFWIFKAKYRVKQSSSVWCKLDVVFG